MINADEEYNELNQFTNRFIHDTCIQIHIMLSRTHISSAWLFSRAQSPDDTLKQYTQRTITLTHIILIHSYTNSYFP